MNNESSLYKNTDMKEEDSTADRGIIPAEVAARREREGGTFKETAEQGDPDSINTTGGATVDQEGLGNNYAVEPEMYVEQPGDLRQEIDQDDAERAETLEEANQDKEGDLSMERDTRGKGPGAI